MQYIDRDGNRHNIPLYGLQPTISPDDDNQLHESPNGLKVGRPRQLEGQTVSVEQVNDAGLKAHQHENRELLDGLVNDGDGKKFLSNDGTYKENSTLTLKDVLDALYPIGSYAFGKKPNIGTWVEVVGDRALWLKNSVADGTTLSQELPNIRGSLAINYVTADGAPALEETGGNTGALYTMGIDDGTTSRRWPKGVAQTTDGRKRPTLYFSASQWHSAYRDGASVQPNAYVMKVYKRTA